MYTGVETFNRFHQDRVINGRSYKANTSYGRAGLRVQVADIQVNRSTTNESPYAVCP